MNGTALQGVLPVAPTVFHADESLDLSGQLRVIDFLIDAGSAAICILANYSEQFSLNDEERRLLTTTIIEHVAGKVPIIVTTSAYSARIAQERCQEAQRLGADMVMLMAPFFGATVTVAPEQVLEYFTRVASDLAIDIMIQDAPMSPTALSVELLAEISRTVPQVRHAKIEMPRTADKVRRIVAAAGDTLPGIYDGEESVTLIPDLDAGVLSTMCSAMVPDAIGEVVARYHDGERDQAVRLWEALLPLIHYENRQCSLTAAKHLLKVGGVIQSATCRAPLQELSPTVGSELEELARCRDPLVLRWA